MKAIRIKGGTENKDEVTKDRGNKHRRGRKGNNTERGKI